MGTIEANSLILDNINWVLSELRLNIHNGSFKQYKDKVNIRCPFCGDSHKSKYKQRGWFYIKTGTFYCFNCNCTHNAITLLAKIKSTTTKEVFKELLHLSKNSEILNVAQEEKRPAITNTPAKEDELFLSSWQNIDNVCADYLSSRYIQKAPYLPIDYTFYQDNKTGRLVIPWIKRGKIYYYQTRAMGTGQSPKYAFPAGMEKGIWGLDELDPLLDYVCFTEGVLDACFIPNCIAVGGIFPNANQLSIIRNLGYKNIIWVSDNYYKDSASKEAIELQYSKGNRDIRVFKWNKNISEKDINDYIVAQKNPLYYKDADMLKQSDTMMKTMLSFKLA